jgi:hypothetical protein
MSASITKIDKAFGARRTLRICNKSVVDFVCRLYCTKLRTQSALFAPMRLTPGQTLLNVYVTRDTVLLLRIGKSANPYFSKLLIP